MVNYKTRLKPEKSASHITLIVVGTLLLIIIVSALSVAIKPTVGAAEVVSAVFGILLLFGLGILYMLPSIVGRKKKNSGAITILNIFLGWTFVGWVIALVWASMKEDK